MNKKIIIFLIFILVLTACTPQAAQNSDFSGRKIQITTTVGMITNVAEIVGGERVEVTGLMGPGVDPHLYKASEGDVALLQGADIIFYNGLHLEAGMSGVLERMEETRNVVAVTKNIDRNKLHAPPEFAGAFDPHVWFDVKLWMQSVEVIRDTLAEADPGSADLYKSNAADYLQDLTELDQYVKAQADRVPAENRVLVTAHDAFSYFGDAYGFEVRGLQGISTSSEASTADMKQLADFITERHIPAIFIESSVPKRNIEALQAAVQSRGWDVQIGGELYSDAMGNTGTPEGTYIGMVRHNIDTIVKALLNE